MGMRRLLKMGCGLSLSLGVFIAAMWLLATRYQSHLGYCSFRGTWSLWSRDTGLVFVFETCNAGYEMWSYGIHRAGSFPPNLGMSYDGKFDGKLLPSSEVVPVYVNNATVPCHEYSFFVPYWCFLVVALPLPTLGLIRRARRSRRLARSLCPDCGYALTGNTSGDCPECGTAIKAS